MSETAAVREQRPQTEQNKLARGAWLIVGLLIVFVKVEGLKLLIHNPRVLVGVLMGIGAFGALWRGHPLRASVMVAIAVAALVGVHPLGADIALGLATVVVLAAGSFLLGWVLNRAEDRKYG